MSLHIMQKAISRTFYMYPKAEYIQLLYTCKRSRFSTCRRYRRHV